MRSLQFIHYAGAPLGINSGKKLASFVRLISSIGSREVGGYFAKLRDDVKDWDYAQFNDKAGTIFEPRLDNLHEMVYIHQPGYEAMQQIFVLYSNLDRYETKDLWIEHRTRKGFWKILGRTDDYVYLSYEDGLYASTMEKEIEGHEIVKVALIGGHGRSKAIYG